MMRILSSLRRPWLVLLLGAQLSGVAAPLADARLEDETSGPVHIEARTDRSCDPVHLHDDCVLCQFLAHRDLLPTGDALAAVSPIPCDRTFVTATAPISARATILERGRAPPSV